MRGQSLHRFRALLVPALLLMPVMAANLPAQQPTRNSSHFALTAPPGRDVLRLLDELELAYNEVRSFGLPLPGMIRGQSYGSTAEFMRHSRGQAFHLALAEGNRLHLQPLAVLLKNGDLARVLRHELTHVALADAAKQGLPRWLNEGMALTVAGERHTEDLNFTSLRQLEDTLARSRSHDHLRAAYGTAGRLARQLMEQHGKEKMLALLRSVKSGGGFERAFRTFTGSSIGEWERSQLRR